jgi:hypothetical protein
MMSKLKLDVDALEVTSFDTDAAAGTRGTVVGASGIEPAPESVHVCIDSRFTGPCCEYTLVLSCVQTNCDECTVGLIG